MAISWTSFMLGLCIGLLGLGVTAYILTVKQTEELNAHHKFFKDYAASLDSEINQMEKLISEKLELVKDAVVRLHELDLDFHQHTVDALNEAGDFNKALAEYSNEMGKHISRSTGLLEELHRDFNEQMKLIEINDKRWDLLQHYIMGDEDSETVIVQAIESLRQDIVLNQEANNKKWDTIQKFVLENDWDYDELDDND